MILPVLLVAIAVVAAALYVYLRKRPTRRERWRIALAIGVGVGLLRAVLASTGWYVVEHTGGPLQVPAFALAMLAWPEAALMSGRRVAPVTPGFYLALSVLLVTSTVVFVSLVALVAGARRVLPANSGR